MLLFWIFLEVNIILFIIILSSTYLNSFKLEFYRICVYYFLIQRLGSIIFLYCFNFDSFSQEFISLIFLVSVCLKIGVFPCHFWVFKLSFYIRNLSFFLLLTFQKLPLMVLIFNWTFSPMIFLVLLFNLLVGSLFIFQSNSTVEILLSSSLYNFFWFFLSSFLGLLFFFLLFLRYSFFLYNICKEKLIFSFLESSFFQKINYVFSFIFIFRMPPIRIFFFKFYILNILLDRFSISFLLLIWLAAFTATIGYFKIFFSKIFYFQNIYQETKYSLNFYMRLLMFSLSLIFFL